MRLPSTIGVSCRAHGLEVVKRNPHISTWQGWNWQWILFHADLLGRRRGNFHFDILRFGCNCKPPVNWSVSTSPCSCNSFTLSLPRNRTWIQRGSGKKKLQTHLEPRHSSFLPACCLPQEILKEYTGISILGSFVALISIATSYGVWTLVHIWFDHLIISTVTICHIWEDSGGHPSWPSPLSIPCDTPPWSWAFRHHALKVTRTHHCPHPKRCMGGACARAKNLMTALWQSYDNLHIRLLKHVPIQNGRD